MIHNIKNKQKDRGFTIVELLVVIVVIGILAAITIVSYTGVTTRAKGAQAKSNASSIVSVAEAYFADKSAYPIISSEFADTTIVAKLPSGLTLFGTTPDAGVGQTTFSLYRITGATTGGKVVYWDYSKNMLCNFDEDTGVLVADVANAADDSCLYWGAASQSTNWGTNGLTAFAS